MVPPTPQFNGFSQAFTANSLVSGTNVRQPPSSMEPTTLTAFLAARARTPESLLRSVHRCGRWSRTAASGPLLRTARRRTDSAIPRAEPRATGWPRSRPCPRYRPSRVRHQGGRSVDGPPNRQIPADERPSTWTSPRRATVRWSRPPMPWPALRLRMPRRVTRPGDRRRVCWRSRSNSSSDGPASRS